MINNFVPKIVPFMGKCEKKDMVQPGRRNEKI